MTATGDNQPTKEANGGRLGASFLAGLRNSCVWNALLETVYDAVDYNGGGGGGCAYGNGSLLLLLGEYSIRQLVLYEEDFDSMSVWELKPEVLGSLLMMVCGS
jgi:hypothetical protein